MIKAPTNIFIKDVQNFHIKFGFTLPIIPTPLSPELYALKIKHLTEEAEEYQKAPDQAHRLDALLDTVYVALGAALLEFPASVIEQAWSAIQTANMSKVRATRAEDSTRNSTFDIIKPPGWTPPDIQKVINDAFNVEENHT